MPTLYSELLLVVLTDLLPRRKCKYDEKLVRFEVLMVVKMSMWLYLFNDDVRTYDYISSKRQNDRIWRNAEARSRGLI